MKAPESSGIYAKQYSIDSSTLIVTEEYLKAVGFENGEAIVELKKKDYKVDSFVEAESIINLLKQGVKIK